MQNAVFEALGFVKSVVENGPSAGDAQSQAEADYLQRLKDDIATATPAAVADMSYVMAQRLVYEKEISKAYPFLEADAAFQT